MSACSSEFSQRIAAYHDQRLDAAAAAQVEAHLKTCAACAAELRELRALSEMFVALRPARLSQIGLARVHRAVDAVADEERGVLRMARWLSAAAAVVLMGATLALTSLSSQSAQAQSPSADLPQAWERVAMSGDSTASVQQSNVVDAEWIVADLSRRSMP
jgi:anti-sigma factor RsiW